MFVEHKEAGELSPSRERGKLRLSEAIRIGKPLVGPEKPTYTMCALACAWAGFTGRAPTWYDFSRMDKIGELAESIGAHLGFDPELARWVSNLHCKGMPALEIADMLAERGY